MQDWNVVTTSVEGARPVLLSGLRRLGVFRGGSQFTLDKGGHTGQAGRVPSDPRLRGEAVQ